jgi:hypothetical protein
MKSTDSIVKFDYSKFESDPSWDSDVLRNPEYWGIHKKDGRTVIDVERYCDRVHWIGFEEFLPKGNFVNGPLGYFVPKKAHRDDYAINFLRDSFAGLKSDWVEEYKPVLSEIRTPKQVEESSRLESLSYTGDSEDYDDIDTEAKIEGIKRINKYIEVINSLYCQFISKIATETDRFTLSVITRLGYTQTDFDFDSFVSFSNQKAEENGLAKVDMWKLPKFNSYNMLRKINNFLKHNSLESYQKLQKCCPHNVRSRENGTSTVDYQSGMFAGDWVVIKDNYIDDVLDSLVIFFENYCRSYLGEDINESNWNYGDYFLDAFNELSNPSEHLGLPY